MESRREEIIEMLAELEHDQWIHWANNISSEVSNERYDRWQTYLIPYADLPEEIKEEDRRWAKAAFNIVVSQLGLY